MLYETLFDLVLSRLPPEKAHELAFRGLDALGNRPRSRKGLRRLTHVGEGLLTVNALGLSFPSPVGVAAGLDKNAEHVEGLGALGFGFVEVGTITPFGQNGNLPPTLVRLTADHALINRMGFPNNGAEAAARHLARPRSTITGVNIGKNRDTPLELAARDYRSAARALGGLADYLVLNVSSPNTPGLRDLESIWRLRPLVLAVRDELEEAGIPEKPMLVKISPDLSDEDVDSVADLALELGLDGIVATNTTVRRQVLSVPAADVAWAAWTEGGGVSGRPLIRRSVEVLKRLRARAGDRLVLVSVGGVSSTDDVWERVLAGATLVQAYTGFVYGGPMWARAINLELARRVFDAGASSIQELVGTGT